MAAKRGGSFTSPNLILRITASGASGSFPKRKLPEKPTPKINPLKSVNGMKEWKYFMLGCTSTLKLKEGLSAIRNPPSTIRLRAPTVPSSGTRFLNTDWVREPVSSPPISKFLANRWAITRPAPPEPVVVIPPVGVFLILAVESDHPTLYRGLKNWYSGDGLPDVARQLEDIKLRAVLGKRGCNSGILPL